LLRLMRCAFLTAIVTGVVVTAKADAICHSGPNSLSLEWTNQQLTICATKVPVTAVLHELARKTGLRIRGLEQPLGATSLQLENVPLESALNALLEGVDFIIVGDLSHSLETSELWIRGESHIANHKGVRLPVRNMSESVVPAEAHAADEQTDSGERIAELEPEAEEIPQRFDLDTTEKFDSLASSITKRDQEALATAVLDSDPVLQSNAYEALKSVNADAAKEALFAAAGSEQPSTRLQALQLLQQSGLTDDRSYLTTLNDALGDSDVQVRMAALQGLARLDSPEAMSYLRPLLHDPDPAIRLMLISSVGTKDKSLISTALQDGDEAVSSAAASLLQEIQNEDK
jgi:hypothetical protein